MNRCLFARDVTFAATVAMALAAGACRPEDKSTVPVPASSVPASRRAPVGSIAPAETMASHRPFEAADSGHLVAWWLRHDQGYMLVIEAVAGDGRLSARYLNPQPVNVSKAEAWNEGDEVRLLVELSDRNYPGSFYELGYRQGDDVLVGVYHNLQAGEDLEVLFTRFDPDAAAPR